MHDIQRILAKLKRLRSEKDIFQIAKEIYEWLEAHPVEAKHT